jgi:uncharacterized protein YkwD
VGRKLWLFVMLLSLVLLSACAQQQQTTSQYKAPKAPVLSNSIDTQSTVAVMPPISLPRHQAPLTPHTTPTPATNVPSMSLTVGNGIGAAPYGPPPAMTAEEIQLTQKLFEQINSDRAARGLYAYTWNATLAGGARLHSWNMYHCGFSHTCPDGTSQCQRIANEGFAGYTDCGENIAYAGPYPTPWQGVYNIQEGMVNEPPTGWHRIHLLSTTLHRVGVGVYVDPSGYIWFTEDFVS